MSRIHLKSNTLVLWLSLSAAVAAAGLGVGCSSSDSNGGGAGESAGGASAGKGGKSGAGAPTTSDAGDSSEGGTDTGTGGTDEPTAGKGGATASGGSAPVGGDAGEPGEGGASGAPDAPDPAIARTEALIASLSPSTRQCPACHQANYAGSGFWKNITPDTTNGIGSWTDQQIKDAIHLGVNADGDQLCNTMERYQFSEAQLDDFVVFLRSLPANSKKITSACPNL